MPQPKSARRAQRQVAVAAAAGDVGCLCGAADDNRWISSESPLCTFVVDLKAMQAFWANLKPSARQSVLKVVPDMDVLPQIAEHMELPFKRAVRTARTALQFEGYTRAQQQLFEQLMEGKMEVHEGEDGDDTFLMPDSMLCWTPPIEGVPAAAEASADPLFASTSDSAVPQLQRMFGGPCNPMHGTGITNDGIIKFDMRLMHAQPALQEVLRHAAKTGVCKPENGIHFRPWQGKEEAAAYMTMIDRAQLTRSIMVVYQRRLQRGIIRAMAVRALMEAGKVSVEEPMAAHQVWSWGASPDGALGLGADVRADVPRPISVLAGREVAQLSAYYNHAYALLQSGQVVSWGGSPYGVGGRMDFEAVRYPTPVTVDLGPRSALTSLSTGHLHTLAVADGGVVSWGSAWLGQLGNATQLQMEGGTLAEFKGESQQGLTNMRPTVYMRTDGGEEEEDECGQPTKPFDPATSARMERMSFAAVDVQHRPPQCPSCPQYHFEQSEQLEDVVSASAGGLHSAAVDGDGRLWVWGCNEANALAINLTDKEKKSPWAQCMGCDCCSGQEAVVLAVSSPVEVDLGALELQGTLRQVACGDGLTVALSDAGEVVSFGASGRLPFRVDASFPEGEVGAAIAAGGPYAMAVTKPSGFVYVWQRSTLLEWKHSGDVEGKFRQLDLQCWTPQQVPFLSGIERVAVSSTHAVAASRDRRVYAWPVGQASLAGGKATAAAAAAGQEGASAYEVPALRGARVTSVAAGQGFSLVATSPDGTDSETAESS